MIYMKFNLWQHCASEGFQFNIITKNDILVFIPTNKVGTLWSVLYFTVTDSYRQKQQQQHRIGREWESFFREWNETGFPPSFFVGLVREEIKVCDAFWKQEMSPWSNAPPGWETRSQDLLLVIIWVAHIFWMPSAEFKWAILI